MRRRELEVTDRARTEAILQKALVVRVGLCAGGAPYIVPMTFGYDGRALYMHCAVEGRKLDMIRENPRVCFEVDIDHEVIPYEDKCAWSMKYRSVMGTGTAVIVEDIEEKKRGLAVIMAHYTDRKFDYGDTLASRVAVIRIDVESMTGKSRYAEDLR